MRYGYESISEFVFMEDDIEIADIILIPGGSHPELAVEAAKLYKAGYAKMIIPSGGANDKLLGFTSEFEFLKSILIKEGVPCEAIIEESKARHTFDNAELSYRIIEDNGYKVKKVILLCKNFHSRRAYLTYRIHFPESIRIIVKPIVDGSGVTKDNWMKSPDRLSKVMTEVVKIGKYFETHFSRLFVIP